MKLIKPITCWLYLMLCLLQAGAQNYVENPSFENLTSCPDNVFQIYKAAPWFSPDCYPLRPDTRGYAMLYTSVYPCNYIVTNVPDNPAFHLEAHKGMSYAGMIAVSSIFTGFKYRQYAETKLKQPLEAGKTYYFSMFYSMDKPNVDPSNPEFCFKTDSLGVYFSKDIIDKNPNCILLPITPQVHAGNKMITPDTKWQELTGCYTAEGGEQYITIGNYADNAFSKCRNNNDSIGYYIYVDDVTVAPKVVRQFDTLLCSGKPLPIDAQKFRDEYTYLENWQYKWDDGVTGKDRTLTQPGKYTLRVVKDCFEDVYTFNVATGDCVCKDYTPTAFTPNGDNVNDRFSPYIICQAGEVTDYTFTIYNRWGQRVFASANAGDKWDGNFKGQNVPAGAYIYMVRYKSKSGAADEYKTAKGTVLLVR